METNDPQKAKLALSCLVKLSRASDTLIAITSKHLKKSKITESQFGVLEMLLHLGPLPQSIIAKKHLKTPGNITHVIDNLELAQLVERIPKENDRRTNLIRLTKSGEKLISELFKEHVNQVVAALSVLSEKEQNDLARICKKLGNTLKGENNEK